MEEFSKSELCQRELNKYQKIYGEVPPPWVFSPKSHPYSINWRMGAGETFIMVWSLWMNANIKTKIDQIKYFKKYKPPPRWLGNVADSI